jgi:Leucine-rich repeat (LRR) protein
MELSKEELQNLSRLFLSKEDTNTQLAFEMMQGQGASKELLTELFAVYKLTEDTTFKERAQKEIEAIASPATIALFKSGKKLSRSSSFDPNEKTIAKNIAYYVSSSNNELNGIKLAKALVEKYGHGYEYLLNNLSSSELITFFAGFKNGSVFSFTKKGIGKIPKEVFLLPNLEEIEEFDMSGNKLATLPAGIAKLKNLKRLKLNSNNLKTVNKNIAKLDQLEFLDLSHNNFKEFPTTITQCSGLIELKAHHMASYFSKVFELPKELAKMENLKILHFHRSNKAIAANLHTVLPTCSQLEVLSLSSYEENEAQINSLKKALPNCQISAEATLSTLNKN